MKTTEFKKVLIALDYNPTAQKVAEEGFSLAKTMGAEVILLHVVTDPIYYSTTEYSPVLGFAGHLEMNQIQLDSVVGLKKLGQHFLDITKQHLNDPTIQTLITEGDIAESILSTANEFHADIIILGTHSKKWMENILIGSVAEKVLRKSPIPLFIIPTKNHI